MTTPLSTLTTFALPLGFALGGLAAGLLLRRTVIARLARAAARSHSRVDDIFVAALRGPVVLWSTTLGLYVGTELIALPGGTALVVQRALLALVIISVTWTMAQLTAALVEHAAHDVAGRLRSASLLVHLARLAVLAFGVLIILQTLGVSITPLLTALGIGGLAVGLALQDTLANVVGGIHILGARKVRPGDFVRLETGEEGYVQDVTWRYTTIRQLPNNLTVVPNAKLASAVITNYYLPDPALAVLVPVGVSYGSDLGHVEEVTVDVAREVMRQVPGGVPDFEPFIRYNAFAESAITFTVVLRGREVVDQHLIRHEFIKRLHVRFRREKIAIPFKIPTLQLSTTTAATPGRRPKEGVA